MVRVAAEEDAVLLLALNEILGDRNDDRVGHDFCELHRVLAHPELLIVKARNHTVYGPLDPNGPGLLAALAVQGFRMRLSDAENLLAILVEQSYFRWIISHPIPPMIRCLML